MDLIDRYVVAVERHLPAEQRAEIIRELSDSLRSEVEDRERDAGRPLTADDQSALLKQRGHPWLMASRYLPQQQLIGPALYPYYRQTMVFVLFWVVLPVTLLGGAIAAMVFDSSAAIWGRVLGAAWNASIYAVGIVTIVFAVLERQHVRITALDNWNPMTLREPRQGRQIGRFETIVGLVIGLTILIWWSNLAPLPDVVELEGGSVRLVPAPIWTKLYWPILVVLTGSVAVSVADLIRPWRTTAVSLLDIGVGVAGAAIAIAAIRSGRYLDLTADARYADQLANVNYWLNTAIAWSLAVLAVILLIDVLYELWQVWKSHRGSTFTRHHVVA
jgi:hypothetical protein